MTMTDDCDALSGKLSKALLFLVGLGGCATVAPTKPVDTPPTPAYTFDQSVPYRTNSALDSTLTIYVYPPSDALDWTNPKTAFVRFGVSAIREKAANLTGKKTFFNDWGEEVSFAYGYRSTMGHTIAHIQCRPAGESAIFDKWASLSGQDFREVDEQNAFDHIGLSVLFFNYADGFIIAGQENRERLAFYRGERRDAQGNTIDVHPRYMSFNVDADACKRLKDLEQHFERYHYPQGSSYEEFLVLQPNPTDHLYFSTNFDPLDTYLSHLSDPLMLEGGGCAPFGVSLIRAAGILVDRNGALDPALRDDWALRLEIGRELLGGPDIRDAKGNVIVKTTDEQGNERRIPVLLLLGTMGDHWTTNSSADNSNPDKPVRFSNYDPQRMWDFVGDVMICLKSNRATCSPIAKTFLSSSYLNGRKAKVGGAFLFTDKRFFKDDLGEIIEVWKETGPFSPGLQPLNNLVEGIQITQ